VSEITDVDDHWHDPPSDHPYWTETSYWGFYVPERRLSGTVYNMWRRNLGLVSSRIWLWDESGSMPHDLLFTSMQEQLLIPDDADPTNFDLPPGLRGRRTGSLGHHSLQLLQHEGVGFELSVEPARPPVAAFDSHGEGTGHFDQHIHVTGEIDLRSEVIEVDCVSIRDPTWSVRPDFGIGRSIQAGYMHGAAVGGDVAECFMVMAVGTPEAAARGEAQTIPARGSLVRDGVEATVRGGYRRTVERRRGRPDRLEVRIDDELGRTVEMEGVALNHLGAQLNPSIFNWFSLYEWTYADGTILHGEDQETWIPPMALRRLFDVDVVRG